MDRILAPWIVLLLLPVIVPVIVFFGPVISFVLHNVVGILIAIFVLFHVVIAVPFIYATARGSMSKSDAVAGWWKAVKTQWRKDWERELERQNRRR